MVQTNPIDGSQSCETNPISLQGRESQVLGENRLMVTWTGKELRKTKPIPGDATRDGAWVTRGERAKQTQFLDCGFRIEDWGRPAAYCFRPAKANRAKQTQFEEGYFER